MRKRDKDFEDLTNEEKIDRLERRLDSVEDALHAAKGEIKSQEMDIQALAIAVHG